MAELLELRQLAQADHVAHMDIGRAGVEALLESQRLARIQHPEQLFLVDYLHHTTAQKTLQIRFG